MVPEVWAVKVAVVPAQMGWSAISASVTCGSFTVIVMLFTSGLVHSPTCAVAVTV